jgi:sulfite reductase (ferredoxin)
MDEAIQNLHIKISGCFNSCGQHHVGDLGFYGVSRNLNGFKVPHFQVVLGGQWEENAGSYGLPIVAVPSKRIPEAVEMLTGYYLKEREKDETFAAFVKRVGKAQMRTMLETLKDNAPTLEEDPDFYRDWADTRTYTTGDIGKGECAGEVVSAYEFAMTDAERMVFNAQILLEDDKAQEANDHAYKAMLKAAKALVQIQYDDVSNDAEEILEEFTERFYDTKVFFDTYAGGKFAEYFFAAHEKAGQPADAMTAKHTIEEAQLFIEAVHTCYNKGAGAETAKA